MAHGYLHSSAIHEFLHTLGLPDLYTRPTSADLLAPHLGRYSIMASGFGAGHYTVSFGYVDTASHLDAWSKIKLGWISEAEVHIIDPSVFISQDVELSITELPSTGFYAVMIPKTATQYYLIEGRRRVGYDSTLPNEGVLITFVDESNSPPVTLIDANPTTETNYDAPFQVGQTWFGGTFQVYVGGKADNSYAIRIVSTTTIGIQVNPTTIDIGQDQHFAITVVTDPPAANIEIAIEVSQDRQDWYAIGATVTSTDGKVTWTWTPAKEGNYYVRARSDIVISDFMFLTAIPEFGSYLTLVTVMLVSVVITSLWQRHRRQSQTKDICERSEPTVLRA